MSKVEFEPMSEESSVSGIGRALTLGEIYGNWPVHFDDMVSRLDASLNPRSPEMLYDSLSPLGLGTDHNVLDIGCGEAWHSQRLAERFGCNVVAVDIILDNIRLARERLAESGDPHKVQLIQGGIEALPLADASIDFVWCRDMLTHVERLNDALRECARVLRKAGSMIVFHTYATALLEAGERTWLFPPLAVVPANMDPRCVETHFVEAGFEVTVKDVIGSEWREYYEEENRSVTSRQMLHLARLRRNRETLLEEFGLIAYENYLANCYWGVYMMLGKLEPVIYVLRKRSVSSAT